MRTTIATSPTPICCRWKFPKNWIEGIRAECPSCRMQSEILLYRADFRSIKPTNSSPVARTADFSSATFVRSAAKQQFRISQTGSRDRSMLTSTKKNLDITASKVSPEQLRSLAVRVTDGTHLRQVSQGGTGCNVGRGRQRRRNHRAQGAEADFRLGCDRENRRRQ